MERAEEHRIKLGRVRDYLAARGLAAVLLRTPANFAWLAAGASNEIGPLESAASLLVTPQSCVLIAADVEMPRLLAEELPHADVEPETFPWQTPDLPAIVGRRAGSGRVTADVPLPDTKPLADDLAALPMALLEPEIERYRWLGEHLAVCVTRACFEARPGLSEHQVAGMLAGDLHAFGITPARLLVAADDRAERFRHPVPGKRRLEAYLLLSIAARRRGLVASITRAVHFGPVPQELLRRQDAVARVDAALHHATRPGARLSDVLDAGRRAFVDAGFPDALEQPFGGPAGYTLRDLSAADGDSTVSPYQPFAWNPSLAGARSGDTLLATPDGPEPVTDTPDLPVLRVDLGDTVIERPGILGR